MSKLSFILLIIISVLFLILLYSCGCDCHCERNLGCKILTVKENSKDSVILTKIYCSQINFDTDTVLRDSVSKFFQLYKTDSTSVTSRDSIYKYESKETGCKEAYELEKEGFRISCAK